MDFEEFLWALGDEMTMPFIRKCFENREGLGPLYRQTMDLFRQYMIVGGMPQAVAKYVETKDFQAVIEKQTLTNRHNICAVEVKSDKRFVTTSLDKFERKFTEQLSSSYVIYDGEYKYEGNRFFIPLYMAGLL